MKNTFFLLIAFLLNMSLTFAQGNSAKGEYASLAIDSKVGDQYGWAINYSSQAEANERALKECRENGGNDCHIVLQFKGGCGVYVVEKGNSSLYGWGTADTREEAERIAMEEARARGGQNLVVRVWGCNEGKLDESEVKVAKVNGVFGFHFTKSTDDKKCFITDVYYQPSVARKSGDSWVWISDAEQKMSPRAKKFWDAVEDNLYGFLGDLKEKAITRKALDWKGVNELDVTNHTLNLGSLVERRAKLENAVKSIKESFKSQGFEIIEVDISL